eukprot:scaffold2455_cov212-Chaetoceros_neogracile.AAC.46
MIEGMKSSQGAMCCDQNGLCLKQNGNINSELSGNYTSMIRLASQLQGFESSPSVMITMETADSATVVKQYDGHTIVMKAHTSSNERNAANIEEAGVVIEQFVSESSSATKGQNLEEGTGTN